MGEARKRRLLIASQNPHKIAEIRRILDLPWIEIVSPADLGIPLQIEESGWTFFENALIKAREGYRHSGLPTVADDSGLVTEALYGMPGVFSSRFGGEKAQDLDNRRKLLAFLSRLPSPDRRARFVCTVALVHGGGEHLFAGVVEGILLPEERGKGGFGYDPLFLYPPLGRTFAELPTDLKNRYSHRGQAFRALKRFLLEKGEALWPH